MSTLEEHDAEQAAITAMCEAGVCTHPECIQDRLTKEFVPTHGGSDPDGSNRQRRIWGQMLAAEMQEITGTDPEDCVSDAISYLLHAAPTFGETPKEALARAVAHFNEETAEG